MADTIATTFQPVLIHRYDHRIKWDLDELREKHQQQADALNHLQQALAEFEGRQVGHLELITFLRNDDPKRYLIGQFTANKNLDGIPIKPEKLEEILEIPPYEHLLQLRLPFADWSKEELLAYYDEEQKSFVPLEISEEDRERITAKHSVYIYEEDRYKTYLAAKQICEGLNFFNAWEGRNNLTPAKLQEALPFLWPLVKYTLKDGRFRKLYFWEVDLEKLGKR